MNKKLLRSYLVLLSIVSLNLLASNLFAMRLPATTLAAGATVGIDARDRFGRTELHNTLLPYGDILYFGILLRNGADVNLIDENGNTPLHLATLFTKNLNVIKDLIEAEARVNVHNFNGETALHCATTTETVEALIRAGAKVDAVDSRGYTALHNAVIRAEDVKDSVEIVKILVKQGANTNACCLGPHGLGPYGLYRPIDLARQVLDNGNYFGRTITEEVRIRLRKIIEILGTPNKLMTLAAHKLRLADVIAAAERGFDGDGAIVPVGLLALVDMVGRADDVGDADEGVAGDAVGGGCCGGGGGR